MSRIFLQILEQWGTKVVPLVIALAVFVSCSKISGGRVYLLGESRIVSGMVGSRNGIDLKNLKISLVNVDGLRTTPAGLKFDVEQGHFSFQLRDSDLYEPKNGMLIDRILSMGNALPKIDTADGDLVAKVEKYSRIEIMEKLADNSDYQVVPYFQGVLPLSKSVLLSNGQTSLKGQVTVQKAGFVRIKVVDELGSPLSGVRVAGISDGKIETGQPLWQDSFFHPTFETTDTAGRAYIGPLDAGTETTRYQILAIADGFCTYLSSPEHKFSPTSQSAPVIMMRKCDARSSAKQTLLPSFPTGLTYLNINSRMVVHTNQKSIVLRLDSRTQNLRGVKVALFETDENYVSAPEPYGEVWEMSLFQSEFKLSLPEYFKISDSQEGKFIIKVSPISGALDDSLVMSESYPELIVYGHKKVAVPSRDALMRMNLGVSPALTDGPAVIDEWSHLKIASITGHTNIVPGLAGGTFTMNSVNCGEGDSLGFSIPAYQMFEPVFKQCVNGVANFTAEEAGFVAAANKISQYGGRQKWRIFVKDKFGNVSENLEDPNALSPNRLNVMTVIVDTSPPSSASSTTRFADESFEIFKSTIDSEGRLVGMDKPLRPVDLMSGLLKIRMTKTGTNGEGTCIQTPYDDDEKNKNGLKGGNATLLGNLNAYIYRDDLNRLAVKSLASETGLYEDVGLMVYKWMIGGNASSVSTAPVSLYTRCRELGKSGLYPEPVARELKKEDIIFSDSGTADFYVRFMDVSGQFSGAVKYSIPACNPGGSSGVCWLN